MTTSLGWTLLGGRLFTGRRPGPRALGGVVLAGAGLVGLLVVLSPTQAAVATAPGPTAATVVVGGCAAAVLAGLAWARWTRSGSRALGLAVGTGIGYGLTAALLKLVTAQLRDGWTGTLHHPALALYAVCVLGPASILLSQNAFQQGRVAALAVTVILVLDPVIGLVTGRPAPRPSDGTAR